MIASISNVVAANYFFFSLLAIAILVTIRTKKDKKPFPPSVSAELKGLAILAVIFAHVGFFLVSDTSFLYPLSTVAGVGVNIFLFLSGYGLVMSASKRQESLWSSYKHRLPKLFLPLWITLAVIFLADHFFLGRNYGWVYIFQSFCGFFNHADLYLDVNSPLWYITPTVFYYLLFPLVFYRKRPWVSALAIYAITSLILWWKPAPISGISYMYDIHAMAFPLGMIAANLFLNAGFLKRLFHKIEPKFWPYIYWPACLIFLVVALYFASDAHVGEGIKEELASLATISALIALFVMKKKENGFLYLMGIYSYEIYLIHWPLMYRYLNLFRFLPAWLAMVLYIPLLIGLAWLIQQLVAWIGKLFSRTAAPAPVPEQK